MSAPAEVSGPQAAPPRAGGEIARFEAIDAHFLAWARAWRAEELQFAALIDAGTLRRAGYPDAFPHLLLSACRCSDPAQPLGRLLADGNLAGTGWLLSPAVCYHAYAYLAGRTFTGPAVFTVRGRCFRHEEEFVPGRRQLEFEMRELILVGAPAELEPWLAEAQTRTESLAAQLQLSGTWEVAQDPFFLPTSRGRQLLQRLHETKKEFLIDLSQSATPICGMEPADSTVAIASINRHGTFFGERFGLALSDGRPAHTACIAFGLDRWAHATATSSCHETKPRNLG